MRAVRRSEGGTKRVAVVTPVVQWPLTAEEEISLWHLRKHLERFDRYVIGLEALPKELADFRLRRFPSRYFADRFAYNGLLLTKKFYRAFADYEYILIYQLDCLVFAGNLEEWCAKGWDYAGAPWFADPEEPSKGFAGVGNGGLSLRRVRRALEVLGSRRLLDDPAAKGVKTGERSKILYEGLKRRPSLKRMAVAGKTLLHRLGYHNNVRWLTRKMAKDHSHEDLFWAYEARKAVRDFRVPEPREALGFAFEAAPRYCYEMNGGRLPFGCHAWAKYDREFWEEVLGRERKLGVG